MKNIYIKILLGMIFSATQLVAGGKYIVPVDTAVIPIPVDTINPIPIYIGVGLVAAGVSKDCPCVSGKRLKDMTYGYAVRTGWDFNQYIGVEARYLNASIEKDFSKTKHYGLFLKPQYHMSKQTNIYGLVGYGKTEIEGCSYSNGTLTKDGFSYGVGFEYDFSSDDNLGKYSRAFDGQGDQETGWGLWIDYQNLMYNEGIYNTRSNLVTAGITYDF